MGFTQFRFAFNVLVLLLVLAASACSAPQTEDPSGNERLRLLATTTIVGDITRQVAGESAVVQVLLPVGTDPHAFEPRPQDVAAISDADLIIASGAGLEEFLSPLLRSAGAEERVVELSAGVALQTFSGEDQASGTDEVDPHTWMDPKNVIVWTRNLEVALSAADAENAEVYTANADAYVKSLQEMDAWISLQLSPLPTERRQLVLDHYTMGYYASAYNLVIVGELVGSISTNAQTSAQELAILEEEIKTYSVPAILVSQTVNPALSEQVARDTGIQLVQIYTGSLSSPDGPAATYLDMMRYNTTHIIEALTP